MTTLIGRSPKDSYQELLKLNHLNAGLDSTLRSVEDGIGVSTPLQLSTTDVALNGLKWPSGGTAGQFLRISTTSGLLEWANPIGTIASQSASSVAITGGTITGLGLPVASSDAATKAYVDAASTGAGGFTTGMEVYSATNPGAGWLPANGATYPISSYPTLASKLGAIVNGSFAFSTATTFTNGYACTNISYANGFFYTFTPTGTTPVYQYSTNGTSFTTLTVPFTASWIVAYGNNTWVGVDGNGILATSTNGTSWTTHPSLGTGNASVFTIMFGNGKFVIGLTQGRFATSTDGITWTISASVNASAGVSSIAFGNGIFMATCGNATVYTSTDAITWSSHSTGGTTNYISTSVAFANGTFAVLDSGAFVQITTNGTSWTTHGSYGGGGVQIVASGGMFAMMTRATTSSSSAPSMYKSTDGINWTGYSTGLSYGYSIAFGAGVIITTGSTTSVTLVTYAKPFTYNPDTQFLLPSLTAYTPAVPYIKT
jgi:Phage Tail Collar Domain